MVAFQQSEVNVVLVAFTESTCLTLRAVAHEDSCAGFGRERLAVLGVLDNVFTEAGEPVVKVVALTERLVEDRDDFAFVEEVLVFQATEFVLEERVLQVFAVLVG